MDNQQKNQSLQLKSLICQIDPIYQGLEQNIQRMKEKFKNYSKQDMFDLILFPEMAFTGYNFDTIQDIRPLLEIQQQGLTFKFLQEISIQLNTYVACGYGELFIDENKNEKYYNSCYVLDREGKLLLNYRKTFLFETDLTWVTKEGDGFQTFQIKNVQGQNLKVGLGICMDILGEKGLDLVQSAINKKDPNIKIWEGKNIYENLDPNICQLAEYCKQQNVDVVLFPTNWEDHEEERDDYGSIEGLINYFVWRFHPIVNKTNEILYQKQWALLIANRVGKEKNSIRFTSEKFKMEYIIFMGSSAIVTLNSNTNKIVSYADKRSEQFIQANLQLN